MQMAVTAIPCIAILAHIQGSLSLTWPSSGQSFPRPPPLSDPAQLTAQPLVLGNRASI